MPPGKLGILRRRRIGQGMHEEIEITNHGEQDAAFTLELAFDADFAHIFAVKHRLETRRGARRLAARCANTAADGQTLELWPCRGESPLRLVIHSSEPGAFTADHVRFALCLAPHAHWELCLNFCTLGGSERRGPNHLCGRRPALHHARRERRHAAEPSRLPRLVTDGYVLQRAYEQSASDFAALQVKGADVSSGECIIAAGIPWFMALFGRDSLLAAYQTLPYYPDAAKGVLRALARRQGTLVDPVRAEEPGKILHEARRGELSASQQRRHALRFPYYGTADATPLFLMLLAAVYRVTGDRAFVVELREPALRALAWLEEYGDRDGDGYVEYLREGEIGLENQGWKDSCDAIRFRDGRLAQPPIALCEVQGYAYAARLGMAAVFEALGERKRAAALRLAAGALRERFNRDFWLPDRGFYALALDADKRPVDALTSNPGHLLWTGIADRAKARVVAERLLAPELFSGWGIRTMATSEGGYNPLSYHCGSVWPHDTSFIVAGLARYGFIAEAARVADGLLAAVPHFADYRLPELFAGYSREEAPVPVAYPTPCVLQAWASGSVFLLITTMLGVDVDPWAPTGRRLAYLPSGIERLRADGLWMGGRCASLELTRGGSRVVARRLAAPCVHGTSLKTA